MVSREGIYNLVKVFYQSPFKTFYINSKDGETIDPTINSVFVSLGMTTSYRQLETIRDIIKRCNSYTAEIVEISSKKLNDTYVNRVTKVNPEQYRLDVETGQELLNREDAQSIIDQYEEKVTKIPAAESIDLGKSLRKLAYLVGQLDESNGGWDTHVIQRVGDDNFRIYHLLVNYKKDSDQEYRIGILVNEAGC